MTSGARVVAVQAGDGVEPQQPPDVREPSVDGTAEAPCEGRLDSPGEPLLAQHRGQLVVDALVPASEEHAGRRDHHPDQERGRACSGSCQGTAKTAQRRRAFADSSLEHRPAPPRASYSGSQCADPLLKSIGSPRELIGSNTKTSTRFVVRLAMNPLLRLSAGPASEKWSVITPVNVAGSSTLFDTRNALL